MLLSYIPIQDKKYRTGDAKEAFLGSIGLLRREGKNLYERDFLPKYDGVKVTTSAIINTSEVNSIEGKLGLPITELISKLADANAELKGHGENSVKVTYHAISIESKQDIVDIINSDPKDRAFHAFKQTKDARIITGVLIGFGHESSSSFLGATDLRLKTLNDINIISVGLSGGTNKQISFSDGTILGYVYDRACWELDENGQMKIARLLTDNPTLFGDCKCPSGTFNDPNDAKKNADDKKKH